MRWLLVLSFCVCKLVCASAVQAAGPIFLIYDTDLGNDVDDVLALGVIHALESRGECRLAAVVVSKDHVLAPQFCDLVNTFYGRPQVPTGRVRLGKTPQEGNYLRKLLEAKDNDKPRYAHDLTGEHDTPRATAVMRKTLSGLLDGSAVIVTVGFATNVARLLDSEADEYSSLSGRELVAKKVKLLAMVAGCYAAERPPGFADSNVSQDVESARRVFAEWPTPIVVSGYEVGAATAFTAQSIANDFAYVLHHPLKEAYEVYQPMPYDHPAGGLTAVLYAVRPERGYFGLSEPGELSVGADNMTVFIPGGHGRHRHLSVSETQIAGVREALVLLASQPPTPAPQTSSLLNEILP